MTSKRILTRIIHKHEVEADWNKATSFVPYDGELIVYDADTAHPYPRFKVGDGSTTVVNLPFSDAEYCHVDDIEAVSATLTGHTGNTTIHITSTERTNWNEAKAHADSAHNYIPTSQKGAASGVATLDTNGKVPTSQLPSYVDDVLEYSAKSSFPTTGETGKIYVDTTTNKTYRWSGSVYVEISASLAIGTTSSTAAAGNHTHSNYVPTSRTVNGKALSSNITLTAADVGALPSTTTIPTVNNATLTIQKNGTTVKTFTANSSSDVVANITVPTGAAADKGVDTSISAGSTSTNLPTSKAVAAFVEGKGYKTTDNNTTYTFATGDSNGQIKITPSSGDVYNVSVKGLGSLAYKSSLSAGDVGAAPSNHAHGNITNSGTITSTAVTSATGVLVYDSNNKIQRATAANARAIIGAGTSNLTIGTTASTAAAGNHTHSTYVPTSRTVNGKALSSNITLSASDVGAAGSTHSHSYLPLSGGTVSGALTVTGGAKISGRYIGSGDDEGLVIGRANNDYAGVCLGDPSGVRSVFYLLPANDAVWRYNNGSSSFDIKHPAKSGTIALTSDLDSKAPAYTYSTTDLTAGSSALTTGKLYFVYE